MNKLSTEQRVTILRCLVDGQSIRGTARITGVVPNTVTKLLLAAGMVADQYQDEKLRNLPCKRLELDEIWSFIYAKQKNVARAKKAPPSAGDVWTWTAICADTKLVPSWQIGDRSVDTAVGFTVDLRNRLRNKRVQLTSDGHKPYLFAVTTAFGDDADFAMLVKEYGNPDDDSKQAHRRYSPGHVNGTERTIVTGAPNLDLISTSYVERNNLTMRMNMRRFTRLTNAFSKKLGNHAAQIALHFFNYNFCRPHQTLGQRYGKPTTPAMAAGVERHRLDLVDLVNMMDAVAPKPNRPKTYRKRPRPGGEISK